jgi:hypothetical protein
MQGHDQLEQKRDTKIWPLQTGHQNAASIGSFRTRRPSKNRLNVREALRDQRPPCVRALGFLRAKTAGRSLLITHPTHALCTLRVRRCRHLTQHSLPGGPLRPYLGRTLHRLIAPALPGAFPHSITSSARISNDGGIVRPRVLAVLRLMVSLNRVGCMTGRSAGFEPWRMRAVYVPT